MMSTVISFRLSPENPREAEALAVLKIWHNQGFSIRHTLTEALLRLESVKPSTIENDALNNLSIQIKKLQESFETGPYYKLMVSNIPAKEKLSDEFVTSILRAYP